MVHHFYLVKHLLKGKFVGVSRPRKAWSGHCKYNHYLDAARGRQTDGAGPTDQIAPDNLGLL